MAGTGFRLPLLDPADASEGVRTALAGEPDLAILRVLAHADSAFVPWLSYAKTLLRELRLAPALRELAMLRTARLASHGEYEWAQHVSLAQACGVRAEQIAAVAEGRITDSRLFDSVQRDILAATDSLVNDGEVSSEQAEQLALALSVGEIVELALIVGHIMLLSRLSASFGLQPEAPAGEILLQRSGTTPT
jgi:alkylhydroperoxidase family enzyme